jgi:lysozyme
VTTPHLTDDLKRDEGCVLEAYPDPLSGGDPWTVGYGHTGPDIHPGVTWTQEQADTALSSDIGIATRALDEHLPWWREHSDLRQDVLANMTYNMGIGKLEGFHNMLAACQRRDYETAADEMLDSAWANQVGDRADRLASQMRSGEHAD